MLVLLTGGSGFISSHLLDRLRERDYRVRMLVRPDEARQLSKRKGVEVIEGNPEDEPALAESTRGVDIVYHLALEANRQHAPEQRWNTGEEQIQANLNGTRRLLRACVESDVRRFIYTSTVAVYERSFHDGWTITEESPLMSQQRAAASYQNQYADLKLKSENLIRRFSRRDNLEYVILRSPIVYGPGAPFAEEWIQRMLHTPRFTDDGHRITQIIHVRDLADALVLAATEKRAANMEFNIAGGDVVTEAQLQSMMRAIASRLTRGAMAASGNGRLAGGASFNMQRQAFAFQRALSPKYDMTRARRYLNFSPKVALRDGLEEMAEDVLGATSPALEKDFEAKSKTRRVPRALDVKHKETEATVSEKSRRSGQKPERRSKRELIEKIDGYYDRQLSVDAFGEFYDHSDFWNYGYWSNNTKNAREACENLMEKLLAFIPRKKGAILDVACGKGATTRHLLKYYRPEKVTGINISENQLEICRKNAPGCTFLRMDATNLEFADESFDNLICVEAACHFDTREDFLREAHRVLKPGGRLVMTDAVLPSSSQTQPIANYLRSVSEYRTVCLRAGFAEAIVKDVTDECWGGFAGNLRGYMAAKMRAGEIGWEAFKRAMTWLQSVSTEIYMTVSCEKR